MKKFHISSRGNAEECRAEIQCRLQGEHYDSKTEALEGYERDNAEYSIPLAVRRDESTNYLEHWTTNNLHRAIKGAKLREGADPEAVKKLDDWAGKQAPGLMEDIQGSGEAVKAGNRASKNSSVSHGQAEEWSIKYALDKVPELYDLNDKQKESYLAFASDVSIRDLNAMEWRLQKHGRAKGKKLKQVEADYNQAVLRANRFAREYDAALKANGKKGYPTDWGEAQKASKRGLDELHLTESRAGVGEEVRSYPSTAMTSMRTGSIDSNVRVFTDPQDASPVSTLRAAMRKIF